MMEAIKYRAFTKEGKMIYNVTPFTWDFCIDLMWHKCIESNGSGVLGSGGSEAKFEVFAHSIVGGALMQCSGFTIGDKELYAGDILEFTLEDGSKEIGVVRLSSRGYWTSQKEGMSEELLCEELDYYKDNDCVRVIGNVHQNPELNGN